MAVGEVDKGSFRRAAQTLGLVLGTLACIMPLACTDSLDESQTGDPAQQSQNFELGGEDQALLETIGYLGFSEEVADPSKQGVVSHDRARAYPGYSLYINRRECSAILIDMDGGALHSWKVKPCRSWDIVKLQPNGDLLLTGTDPTSSEDRSYVDKMYLMRLTWDSRVLWKRMIGAHHDVGVTPDGRPVEEEWSA